ncbi:MAG TPA: hypothetical protein VFQ54_13375, partial [Thermomicrobiales bacterium]|nr:hypothetical protein [Thermomicrobiales bacterium]
MVAVIVLVGLGTSVAEGAQSTTRTSPTAYGKRAEVGDYEVRLKSVNFNAARWLQEQDSHVDSPAAGNVYVVADVELTYKGATSGTPAFDLEFKAVGDKNRGYDQSNSDCGSIPNELY